LELGFTEAVAIKPSLLNPREEIRAACAEDRCRAYGKNWMCPPYCGTPEQCAAEIRAFSEGILVQTVGKTEKLIDTRAYRRIEEAHLRRFYRLCAIIRAEEPNALCLGSGACRVCETCAWPDPCRMPEQAVSSMEAYGLFVTEVCREHGVAYHHGERTVTYTSCILFSKKSAEEPTGQD